MELFAFSPTKASVSYSPIVTPCTFAPDSYAKTKRVRQFQPVYADGVFGSFDALSRNAPCIFTNGFVPSVQSPDPKCPCSIP